jgi:predicted esterase
VNIPYCQVGRDEQMSWNQPEELTEQMRLSEGLINSEMDLDQHVQLTEEEDLRDLLMIGGIQIFLPFSQEEAEVCVAYGATTTAEQSVVTVRKEEELEQTLEAAQADEGENEHSGMAHYFQPRS